MLILIFVRLNERKNISPCWLQVIQSKTVKIKSYFHFMLFIWVRAPAETADQSRCTLLQLIIHLLLWDFEAFPGQMEYVVPLACSGGAFHLVNVVFFFWLLLLLASPLVLAHPNRELKRCEDGGSNKL